MRYFSYHEYVTDESAIIVTKSEDEIRKEYWPHWHAQMMKKFDNDPSLFEEIYSFEDCLDDWIVVNYAWEVKQ